MLLANSEPHPPAPSPFTERGSRNGSANLKKISSPTASLSPYEADEACLIPTDSIADMSSKGVTFWKNILSLFGGIGANGFEGVGWFRKLVDG